MMKSVFLKCMKSSPRHILEEDISLAMLDILLIKKKIVRHESCSDLKCYGRARLSYGIP